MVGFSRLVSEDESGTHRLLKLVRRDLVDPVVADNNGRIVKTMGDGFLCEFHSIVGAAECALDWQARVRRFKDTDGHRLRFRIGIALGDIITDEGDVFGDGVNIAARLESLADAGGILISEPAYWQLKGKVEAEFDDLGYERLKNIPDPVRVYRLRPAGSPGTTPERPEDEATAIGRPSIAVLPFVNRSGHPDQDYFADGITEDIITALSRIRWFLVIARNTVFAYKGRSMDPRDVSAELDVRYILEGSVRRSGDRVRVTAELTDGASGHQLWARRYDRDVVDIFEVQDDITLTIVGALEPELGKQERERARARVPGNLPAWDLYQRGMAHLYQLTRDDLDQARRMFDAALEIDPELAQAHTALAEADYYEVVYGFAGSIESNRERALRHARRAVSLDPEDAAAHSTLGRIHYLRGEHPDAIREFETALETNPGLALAHYGLGAALVFSGRPGEALESLETAIRLSPQDPNMGSFLVRLADAYFLLGDPEKAVEIARRALQQPRFQWSRYSILLAALAESGRREEASGILEELLETRPDFSVEFVRTTHLYTDRASFDRYLDALREAGVPEGPGVDGDLARPERHRPSSPSS